MLPTLLVILAINFVLIQTAPSGPIEQQLARMDSEKQAWIAQGMSPETLSVQMSAQMIDELNVRFGFDLPLHERFWMMVQQFAQFDLGQSFFQGQAVADLIAQKLPTTLMFGALCLLVAYGFGIIIGVYQAQARRSSVMLLLALLHAMPVFMLATLLLVLFAGVWRIFPVQGVMSSDFAQLSMLGKIGDVLHHLALPVLASSAGSIAGVAYLTKFSTMSQLNMPYVTNLRAQGFGKWRILYTQVLKNALLPIAANLPLAVVGLLFSGNFLIEVIFGIDGIGRLAFDALTQRDYPLIFGILFVFTLLSMVAQLIFDVLYHYLDRRIDYS